MFTALLSVVIAGVVLGQPPLRPAGRVTAVGVGFQAPRMPGPQGRLMARRAAEVGAVCNLHRTIDPSGRTQRIPFRYVSANHRADGRVEVVVRSRR